MPGSSASFATGDQVRPSNRALQIATSAAPSRVPPNQAASSPSSTSTSVEAWQAGNGADSKTKPLRSPPDGAAATAGTAASAFNTSRRVAIAGHDTVRRQWRAGGQSLLFILAGAALVLLGGLSLVSFDASALGRAVLARAAGATGGHADRARVPPSSRHRSR